MHSTVFAVVAAAASSAWGAGDPQVQRADYLLATARPDEAIELAAEAIHDDITDVEAHFTYIRAMVFGSRGSPYVAAVYDRWATHEPDNPVAAAADAYATYLTSGPPTQGPWCEPVASALQSVEGAGLTHPVVLEFHLDVLRVCPGDRAPVDDLVREHGSPSGKVLLAVAESQPSAIQQAVDLVQASPAALAELTKSRTLRADETFRSAAESTLKGIAAEDAPSPELLLAAVQAAHRLESAHEAPLTARLADLDSEADLATRPRMGRSTAGDWYSYTPRTPDAVTSRQVHLHDLGAIVPARRAVRELLAIEHTLPASGPLRETWTRHMAANYAWFEPDAAISAWEDAILPGGPDALPAAIDLAKATLTLKGLDPKRGLELLDQALALPVVFDVRNDRAAANFEDWAAASRTERMEAAAWKARLELHLGQPAAALQTASTALLVAESGPLHLVAGLALHALDRDREAGWYLGRGLSMDAGDNDGALVREGRRTARRMWRSHGWAPTFDDWVASARPAFAPTDATAVSDRLTDHYRVGQTFPDFPIERRDGTQGNILDTPGVKVVEFWATWCGPCIQGLPALGELADRWKGKGVDVFVVSIDEPRELFLRYKGFDGAYLAVWGGPAASRAARVSGVPATFVVDDTGTVVAFQQGIRTGDAPDTRLEDALHAVVD